MRVNIQFSVDTDEIPDRVVGFVQEAENLLDFLNNEMIASETKTHLNNKNVLAAIDLLSKFRETLAEVDMRLDDCMNILGGYQKLLMGELPQINSLPEEV